LLCTEETRDLDHEIPLCAECKEKREYNEWKERNEKRRIKESKNPIVASCYKIRNEIPKHNLTWQ
jgi:hypothetical protein